MSIKQFIITLVVLLIVGGVTYAVVLPRLGYTVQISKVGAHDDHGGHDDHGNEGGHDDHGNEGGHDDHGDEGGHDDHGDEGGHDDHGDEGGIQLSVKDMQEFGIKVAKAGSGTRKITVSLPGEVQLNADTVAHITPRVGGVVQTIHAKLGDTVKAGQVLAVLQSREIAEAKASYLSKLERLKLRDAVYKREESLWKEKNITSEQEYLNARQAQAEARIELRGSENQLHALGFSNSYLKNLSEKHDESYTRLNVVAPRDGVIIEKHVTLGEVLRDDSIIFTVADLSTVWGQLTVYRQDLPRIRSGQTVDIAFGKGISPAKGTIDYITPIVREDTRTATARVVIDNSSGVYLPGLFVTAKVEVREIKVPLIIPRTAVQTLEGQTVVFLYSDEGFDPIPVKIGRSDATHVEILTGIKAGQQYVAKGSTTVKFQLAKSGFESGHNH